jgi:methyltransferase (TIGR00027 family)
MAVPFDQPIKLSSVHMTALKSAGLRAAHLLIGSDPKIFRDELALPLCDMSAEAVIAMAARTPAASAASCVLRSRFTEERLARASHRLDQYLLLGAGADSYALRMGDRLGHLTVFEVDEPVFLAWKQQRIAQMGLAIPEKLRFVPCDFETSSLSEALATSDFDADKPCFISWLGVTQYLTVDATKETLRWAGSLPTGSEIILTFLDERSRSEGLVESMAEQGIHSLTHFTPQAMTKILREACFSQIEHLTSEDANFRYFRNRSDGLRAPGVQRLVSAIV